MGNKTKSELEKENAILKKRFETERTIASFIRLTVQENDIIEELQRIDKEVYCRRHKLTKQDIIKEIIKLGIPAFRNELLNEPDSS